MAVDSEATEVKSSALLYCVALLSVLRNDAVIGHDYVVSVTLRCS
jgi:hypothetical protein